MTVCLSVCPSGCLSVCLSGCLSVCMAVCLSGLVSHGVAPAWDGVAPRMGPKRSRGMSGTTFSSMGPAKCVPGHFWNDFFGHGSGQMCAFPWEKQCLQKVSFLLFLVGQLFRKGWPQHFSCERAGVIKVSLANGTCSRAKWVINLGPREYFGGPLGASPKSEIPSSP